MLIWFKLGNRYYWRKIEKTITKFKNGKIELIEEFKYNHISYNPNIPTFKEIYDYSIPKTTIIKKYNNNRILEKKKEIYNDKNNLIEILGYNYDNKEYPIKKMNYDSDNKLIESFDYENGEIISKIDIQYSSIDNIKTKIKTLYITKNNGKSYDVYEKVKIEAHNNNKGLVTKEIHFERDDEVSFLFNYYYSD